jgi:N-acetylglucosamine kinase-like BadF-type ATPase
VEQVAAVDGGGTKTAAAMACRTGRVTLLPPGPGCNPQDGPGWAATLDATLAALGGPVAAVVGLPGWGEVPEHDRAMAALVGARLPGAAILNDVELAWRGAFPDADGVLILAGTGSMAMARGTRVGGWGDLFGDEGSAFWIGRAALAEMSRAIDGRAASLDFARALGDRLGCGIAGFAPLDWAMGQAHPRSAMAGVARDVDALAEGGCPVASGILQAAGAELVTLGRVAARRAGAEDADWAAAGSVFRSRTVMAAVAAGMGRAAVAPRFTALGGGLWAAAVAAGWAPDAAWGARVAAATGGDTLKMPQTG